MFNLTILSDLANLTGLSSTSPYLAITVCCLVLFCSFTFFSFVFSFFEHLFHV